MREHEIDIDGLRTRVIGAPEAGQTMVLLMHGYDMKPEDLSPFAHSLGVPALYLLPQAPHRTPTGYAWWDIDTAARTAALQHGPRDLVEEIPPGLAPAREGLGEFIETARRRFSASGIILGGFSQGGMLACDYLLHHPGSVGALILMSASRINFAAWQCHRSSLHDVPVFISHGRADPDLAFAAGEQLRDFAAQSGAGITWVPFDQGHQIPLVVWRRLRKFITASL